MPSPGVSLRKRIIMLFIATLVGLTFLSGRLAWIQFYQGGQLKAEAVETRTREVEVQPRRGIIYDRRGRELAISVNTDSIYAVPTQIDDPGKTAATLAAILGIPEEELRAKLTRDLSFVWIQRKVDEEKSRRIKEAELPGIYYTQESRRYYPKGELLAHVLGFAGLDNQGLEGIEVTYDDLLRGVPGRIVVEFDARGREIPEALHHFYPATDGFDLYLTIDETIQYIVERELEKVMAETNALHVAAIAMEPDTGAVLAMAARPAFDPNVWSSYTPKEWRNILVSDSLAPGSVFKPITAASGMDPGLITPTTGFHDPGSVKVPGAVISNWNNVGLGSTNFAEGFKKSANVVFVKASMMIGMENFYRYLDAFGFMDRTDIDLPGEARAIVPVQEKARPVDLAVMSFGQTLSVTPIQMATAIAAIANGGTMVVPHLAGEFRDKDGNVVRRIQPPPRSRAISTQTSAGITELMERVVADEDGTGTRAQIPGYRVGGKTGTANKVIGGRLTENRYLASFIGFAPADDPKVLLYVLIDEPQGIPYGGWIAAPVFGSIMRDVLHYLEIPPSATPAEGKQGEGRGQGPVNEQEELVPVPSLLNLTAAEATPAARAGGFFVRVEGGGERVISQVPPAGARAPAGSTLVVYTEALATESPASPGMLVTVPSVAGKTMREAATLLGEVGLLLQPEGTGLAFAQDPRPGTKVAPRSRVRVQFRAEGEGDKVAVGDKY